VAKDEQKGARRCQADKILRGECCLETHLKSSKFENGFCQLAENPVTARLPADQRRFKNVRFEIKLATEQPVPNHSSTL
jgi:hypothetical protein